MTLRRIHTAKYCQIEVKSVSDVQAALAFSRFTGTRLSVKNKGHDYKGRSSGKNTLNLWVSCLICILDRRVLINPCRVDDEPEISMYTSLLARASRSPSTGFRPL